jgi:hypothetical protein
VPKLAASTKIARDQSAIAGVRKHWSRARSVRLGGVEYTVDELAQVFDEHLQALERVRLLTIERSAAVAQERAIEKKVLAVHADLKVAVIVAFGKRSRRMLDFGIRPDKKPKMSAETKKRANEKRQATRKERGVMGKRQLAAWKKKRKAGGG